MLELAAPRVRCDGLHRFWAGHRASSRLAQFVQPHRVLTMSSVALASSLSVSALKVGLGRDGHFLEELGSPDDIKKMLDSKFPTDKVAGMKSVLALAYLGRDASTFFSDVVKNVAAANMELKKLVYMYLVRYAGEQPDLAQTEREAALERHERARDRAVEVAVRQALRGRDERDAQLRATKTAVALRARACARSRSWSKTCGATPHLAIDDRAR